MRKTGWLVLFGVLAGSAAWAQETPSPALLVLHKGENAMAIVDPATGKVLGHVPTGRDPHELAVSADGKLAFASNYGGGPQGGNTLSVIDIEGRKEIHRVDLSPLSRPHGLWVADGKVYFTAEGNMAIGRYDPALNKVDWIQGTGQERTHMILVANDQKTIFTSNVSSNTISILERGNFPQGGPGGPPRQGPGGPPPGFGGPPPDGPPPRWAAAWPGWSSSRKPGLEADDRPCRPGTRGFRPLARRQADLDSAHGRRRDLRDRRRDQESHPVD